MAKQKLSRTTNPIHFEDLEPHSFESLVRQLLYDLRDWATLEATGQGGADDGYDARAFEKASGSENGEPSQVEGNLWMIQCKREHKLGPTRVKDIIEESIQGEVPYGFILAAPTNFSKKSYDVFRDTLREKGVMEFYLWGKPTLEDMLYFPKNDRILFTFFGVSFVSNRKSRATEVRAVVTTKNKLQKILQSSPHIGQRILVRDIKDTYYPKESAYPDFSKEPKWKEYFVTAHHPKGLRVKMHKYYASVDEKKKQFDYFNLDTLPREEIINEPPKQEESYLRDFHQMLPTAHQADYIVEGLIKYEDILVIDDQGDAKYEMPHLYVDFRGENGPFCGFFEYFDNGNHQFKISPNDCKQTSVFPEKVAEIKWGVIHKKNFVLPRVIFSDLEHRLSHYPNLYLPTDLNINKFDVITTESESEPGRKEYFQIKSVIKKKVKDILQPLPEYEQQRLMEHITALCDNPKRSDSVLVCEVRRVYEHQFKKHN